MTSNNPYDSVEGRDTIGWEPAAPKPPQMPPQVSEIVIRNMLGNDFCRIECKVDGVLTIRERVKTDRAQLLATLYDAAHRIEVCIRELQGERT